MTVLLTLWTVYAWLDWCLLLKYFGIKVFLCGSWHRHSTSNESCWWQLEGGSSGGGGGILLFGDATDSEFELVEESVSPLAVSFLRLEMGSLHLELSFLLTLENLDIVIVMNILPWKWFTIQLFYIAITLVSRHLWSLKLFVGNPSISVIYSIITIFNVI